MKKLIIFDIDGTLTDTVEIDDKLSIAVYREIFDLRIDEHEWNTAKNLTTGTDFGMFNYFYKKINSKNKMPGDKERFKLRFLELLNSEQRINPGSFLEIKGAVDFINYLRVNNAYDIGIATGSWRESGLLKMSAIGIDISEFNYACSDDFSSRIEIIGKVIWDCQLNNKTKYQNITYIGDGIWDYYASKALDIKFIGIGNNPDFKKERIKNVVKNYKNIGQFLSLL